MARATGKQRKHGVLPVHAPAQGKRRGCTRQKAPTSEEKKSSPSAKPKAKGHGCTRPMPWNKGVRQTKSGKQHLFIPRDQIPLFLAVALYWAGPKYACVLWLTLVTSRRISETLLLRGTDIRVQGGEDHDAGHILFQLRPEDDDLGGSGKLGAEKVVARLSKDAIAAIQQLRTDGLEYELRPVLEPFKVAAPLLFQMKPLNKGRFQLDTESDDFIFATASKKKNCRPNMSRQSVWDALKVVRKIMFQLTGNRRYNPAKKFQGSRVTVHGATRHTSASLLLSNKHSDEKQPSEPVILEIQQRSDARVFWKHYYHAEEEQVEAALEYGAAPSLYAKEETPTPAAEPPSSWNKEAVAVPCTKQTVDASADLDGAKNTVAAPCEYRSPSLAYKQEKDKLENTVAAPCEKQKPVSLPAQDNNHVPGKVHQYVSRNAGVLCFDLFAVASWKSSWSILIARHFTL